MRICSEDLSQSSKQISPTTICHLTEVSTTSHLICPKLNSTFLPKFILFPIVSAEGITIHPKSSFLPATYPHIYSLHQQAVNLTRKIDPTVDTFLHILGHLLVKLPTTQPEPIPHGPTLPLTSIHAYFYPDPSSLSCTQEPKWLF